MSAEAFRLLRAIVSEEPNDLFIVGDAHQRIYRHRVSLGQCGINIKGRGKKLKINYRTTDEIRRFAVALLEGREIDDLDGGADQQKGYMSLTHGQPPLVRRLRQLCRGDRFPEAAHPGIAEGVGRCWNRSAWWREPNTSWKATSLNCRLPGLAPTRSSATLPSSGTSPGSGLATMHRVKGLEFEHVIVVAANQGHPPTGRRSRRR